jgi:hypothetical protein
VLILYDHVDKYFLQLICMYPSNLLAWMALFGSGLLSSHFMLRNLGPVFLTHTKQEAMIFVVALGWA